MRGHGMDDGWIGYGWIGWTSKLTSIVFAPQHNIIQPQHNSE